VYRSRVRASVSAVFALAIALVTSACGGDGAATHDAGARPVAAPEGLVWEATLGEPSRTLSRLRDRLAPVPLAAAIPRRPGDVLETLASLPSGVISRVPPGATIRAIGIRGAGDEGAAGGDGDLGWIVTMRIAIDRDHAHALGPGVALLDGAPNGARWVGRAPSRGAHDDTRPVALAGEVIAVSDSVRTMERALAYAAQAARGSARAPSGLELHVADGYVAGPLRALLDELVRSTSARLVAQAREERARHAEAPELGEPEELVRVVREKVERLVALLPDIGAIDARVGESPCGLMLTVDVSVRPRSPLARALDETPSGAPFALDALPRDVALAWSAREREIDRAAAARARADAIARVAGDRLDAPARSAIDAALSSWASARSDAAMVAVGAGEHAPWALVATAPRAHDLDVELLRRALATRYLAGAGSVVLGCDGPLAPRDASGSATRGEASRVLELCGRARSMPPDRADGGTGGTPQPSAVLPRPRLEVTSTAGALVIALVRSERAGTAQALAARLSGEPAAAAQPPLGQDPDAMRCIGALGDSVLGAGVIVPARLLAAAAILPAEPLLRASSRTSVPERPGAVGVGVARTRRGLRTIVHASPEGFTDLLGFLDRIL